MLDLRFFRNPRFTAATTAITFVFFVMFGTYFIIAQYLQFVRGYSPLSAGVRMLPWALAYMASATQSAKLVERFGQRKVVSSGLVIVGVGLALMSTSTSTSPYWWFAIAPHGAGRRHGDHERAVDRRDHASLPLDKAGVGSAVNDTTRELGGALGVAVFGSLVASTFRSSLGSTVDHLTVTRPNSLADALREATSLGGHSGKVLADTAREAYVHAFDTTLLVGMVVVIVASAIVFWLLRPSATAAVDAALGAPSAVDARADAS